MDCLHCYQLIGVFSYGKAEHLVYMCSGRARNALQENNMRTQRIPYIKSKNNFLLHVSVDNGTSTFYPNIAIQISKLVDSMFKKKHPPG